MEKLKRIVPNLDKNNRLEDLKLVVEKIAQLKKEIFQYESEVNLQFEKQAQLAEDKEKNSEEIRRLEENNMTLIKEKRTLKFYILKRSNRCPRWW